MHFSQKELHAVPTTKQLEMLRSKNVEWEDMPAAYKYGVFVKKERYEMDTTDNKGNPVKAMRSRIVTSSVPFDKFTPENEKFLLGKYLNE